MPCPGSYGLLSLGPQTHKNMAEVLWRQYGEVMEAGVRAVEAGVRAG
jgi:hypothetical protein